LFSPNSKTPATLLLALTLLSACDKPETKAARYVKRGNEWFEQGAYEKARLEYKNAERLKPTDADIMYRMGLVDEATGDLKAAFADFTRAEQQDAAYRPAQMKVAEYYLAGGHTDEAEKRIDDALIHAPEMAEVHAAHAALLFRQNHQAEAAAEAKRAIGIEPDNVVAVSILAQIDSKDNPDKARADLDAAIARHPKNTSLLVMRIGLLEKTGDIKAIEAAYQALFAATPTDARYRARLALFYAHTNHLDEAESTLRAAIAALPDAIDLRHQLVQFLDSYRGAAAAEKEIIAQIDAAPDRAEPYAWLVDLAIAHNTLDQVETRLHDALAHTKSDKQELGIKTALARVSYLRGHVDDARALAAEALAKDPNNLDALFVRAHIEAGDGDDQQAIADLRSILRDRPKTPQALAVLAEIYLKQKHFDLAIETLNLMIEADPMNTAARVRLAQLYDLNNNPPHAMDLLFAITKAEPTFAPAWASTAEIAIEQKNWDTATLAIDRLDALDGQKTLALLLRGQLQGSTGKIEEAVKSFQTVIDADPTTPIAEKALTALVATEQQRGHLGDAIAYLTTLKTDSPTVATLLGECYLANRQNDLAVAAFDAAIAAHARMPEPYLERALFYNAAHDEARALATLDQAMAAAPYDPRAGVMKAEIFANGHKTKEAIAMYDQVLTRHPDIDAVANNLAELIADYAYDDPRLLAKAGTVVERFAVSPDPYFLDTLAWVYYRQGQNDQAGAVMTRVLALLPNPPPQVHYHNAAILLKRGADTEAAAALAKATPPNATYPGIDDARALAKRFDKK